MPPLLPYLAYLAGTLLAGAAATAVAGGEDGQHCPHACTRPEPGPPGPAGLPGPTLPPRIVEEDFALTSQLNSGSADCDPGTAVTGGVVVTPLGGNNLTVQL